MRYSASGVMITCPCCQNDTFKLDHRQLNTSGASLFGLDWANKSAAILVCQRCTHISWFMKDPSALKE
jgi:predicted nucleic-acid-binding Zn-ribbon protein